MSGKKVAAIVGWASMSFGTIIWFYGYFVSGHPPFLNWSAYTPGWIADYLTNAESEIGMALVCVSMIPIYWPTQK